MKSSVQFLMWLHLFCERSIRFLPPPPVPVQTNMAGISWQSTAFHIKLSFSSYIYIFLIKFIISETFQFVFRPFKRELSVTVLTTALQVRTGSNSQVNVGVWSLIDFFSEYEKNRLHTPIHQKLPTTTTHRYRQTVVDSVAFRQFFRQTSVLSF